jgi:hypothetical protein
VVAKTAALGVALAALVGTGLGLAWGRQAAVAGALFGLLAAGLQTLAVGALRPAIGGPHRTLFLRYGVGMGLRLLGVVAIPVAVLAARDRFPPLPTALGYLGVIVPLLFFETRLFR